MRSSRSTASTAPCSNCWRDTIALQCADWCCPPPAVRFAACLRSRLRLQRLESALRHPTWQMGPRITVDSATLMNKALEVIEAHHLFGFSYDAIEVVVHPQSIVHAIVELVDGTLFAHMGEPDIAVPIRHDHPSPS